jgi:hypothetical protein
MQTKTSASNASDFIRQRSAVYHGLRQVLTETEASAALVLWSERFSETGSVFSGLNNFVHDVCTSYNKPALQRELVQAINKALILREGELPDAPAIGAPGNGNLGNVTSSPSIKQATPSAAGQATVNTPEFQTFKILILDVLGQVQKHQADLGASCREFIKESVNNMPWSEAQQEQLIQLLDTGHTVQIRVYRPGQLKTLMSHLTVWLEENLGADIATRMVDQAIADVSKIAEARHHSPELFI